MGEEGEHDNTDRVQLGGRPGGRRSVACLPRPGGNLTGVSFLTMGLYPKRLQLLSELVPKAESIAMLANAKGPNTCDNIAEIATAVKVLGKEFKPLKVAVETDFEPAFASLQGLKHVALIVQTDPFIDARAESVDRARSALRGPSCLWFSALSGAGGLMSYGASIAGVYR